MASNMQATEQLTVPFRRATHIPLNSAMRHYIDQNHGQHPETFADDLEIINSMRRDAVNVHEAHSSGIKKLQCYAAQLVWVCGKFPMDVTAEFLWYPALGYNVERPTVQRNLKFDLINILYNLGALYCQLAVGTSQGDVEGLKTAASYYMQAAGVFKHIKATLLSDPDLSNLPEDLDEATLESLVQLMLAQSQECFWMRAVSEGYKDATIAKLAAQLSDFYGEAADAAVKSDAISRAWIHHMSAKNHHFAAAAQYRASLDCLEKQKYGEEIARLQDALRCTADGLKEGRGGHLSKPVQDDLNSLKRRVEEDLKRAERDNDVIYLQVVPSKPELKKLDRASMAVSRIPPQVEKPLDYVNNGAEFGAGLFSRLVPFAVHLAVSVYEERRDRLVNQNIIHEMEALTEELQGTLLDLGLPGALQAMEKPLGLPGTLTQHAEEMRFADAVGRVQRSFADIDKLRAGDRAVFDEGRALLAAESDEDAQLRRKYGSERWTRPDGHSDPGQGRTLWTNADEIEGYFASSGSSDGVVRDMFATVKDMLGLLAGPDRALLDFVPSSRKTEIPETVKPALGRLRSSFNDVQRLEMRRRKRVGALRDKARADDIKTDILKETARLERAYPSTAIVVAHFDGFFVNRLRDRYDSDQEAAAKDADEQEKLLDDLARASRDFAAQKRAAGDLGGGREREAALQKLDNAYYKYKEIVRNVEVARKFYNDLSKIVASFRDQCRTWVQERRRDAQAMEDELSMPVLSSLSLGQRQPFRQAPIHAAQQAVNPQSGGHAYFQPEQIPQPLLQASLQTSAQQWPSSTGPQPPPGPMPPPAPLQQQQDHYLQQQQQLQQQQYSQHQMWTPDMGIRFGAAPSATGAPQPPGAPQAPQASGNDSPRTWNASSGIRFG